MDSAPKPPLLQRSRLLRAFTAGDRWIFGLALALTAYYCATRGIFQGKASGDGYFGFMYLPSLLDNHTLDLAKTVPFWARILGTEKTGHVANPCPVGPLFFWTPTYLLARGMEVVAGLVVKLPKLGPPYDAANDPQFDFWMAGLGSFFAGLAGLAATFRLLARRLSVGAARFGTIVMAIGTPLAWYLTVQPMYQHACAFFVVALLVERWDAWREAMTFRRWLWLGFLGGAAMLMRLQEATWLILPGLDAAAQLLSSLRARRWREARQALIGGAAMAAVALIVFVPQLLVWRYYFGFIRPPQPPGHMRWLDPALVATVFGMRGGLLPWSPALYLVVPGLILMRKKLGGLAWRLGLLLAIEVWVNASAWDHWGSWAFGARRFTDANVAFAVGIAAVYEWAKSLRGRVVVLSIGVFCATYGALLMDLTRRGKIKNSGSYAFPASTWIKWADGPAWLGRITDVIGYPFCQPAGWIYAAIYHVPPKTFEGVVGTHVMERDCRIHSVVYAQAVDFADPGERVVGGIIGPPVGKPPNAMVPVKSSVRILVPMFASEPVKAKLTGDFHFQEAKVAIRWNGEPVVITPTRDAIIFEVPKERVHSRSRTNVVELSLPEGTMLKKLELASTSVWY
jgi:hypothetical protein